MKSVRIENEEIMILSESDVSVPAVYLNSVSGEGDKIWRCCREMGCLPFTLISIGNLKWNDDMTPWEAPPVFKGNAPFGGLAEIQLHCMLNKIIPYVEIELEHKPLYSAIAGYSLAGLFAMWSACRTDKFSRIACSSGSFWFPGFMDYMADNEFKVKPDCVYLSLGDLESHTKNKYLKSVEKNTRELYRQFCSKNIHTIFEVNRGNHFKNADYRMAKGICRMLE